MTPKELEKTYIKEIKKLVRRIDYASIFPPNALDEMEESIRDFDVVQKEEQGAIRIKDVLLFPGGTIVNSGPTCAEDGPEDGSPNHQIHLGFLESF
ncbi:MAG: hypothetical protein CM1200mP5_5340 [Candidatus Pelagibacterales bacterium]|nr:MAG: hypothetical protein CM1200mP5_5340 [Pelagibacterales bacterium]